MFYLKTLKIDSQIFTLVCFEPFNNSILFKTNDWLQVVIDLLHLKHDLIISPLYKEEFVLNSAQLKSKAISIEKDHLFLLSRSKHFFKDLEEKLDNFDQLAQFLRKKLKK